MKDNEEIIIEEGAYTGETNYMMVGETDSTHTTLNFVYKWKHKDGKWHGKIGPQVHLDNRDLPGLASLLSDRAKKLNLL